MIRSEDSEELDVASVWRAIQASGLLEEEDTAVIFYSLASMERRLRHLQTLFRQFDTVHTVAIKSAPHPAILKRIVQLGHGLEAASFEEVRMALAAGADPARISYNSPVKTRAEIAQCIAMRGGLRLNANSIEELGRVREDHGLELGLRVNPLVDPGSSSNLFNVSGRDSKFGVPIDMAEDIAAAVRKHRVGTLHVHVGSQVSAFSRVVDGIMQVFDLADVINDSSTASTGSGTVHTINIGGGVPFSPDPRITDRTMATYVELLAERLAKRPATYRIITEFGQWVHGNNGIAFSQVEYSRKLSGRRLAYIHIGADMFPREVYATGNSLSFVGMKPDGESCAGPVESHDITGPLCFQGDFLARGVSLPTLNEDDILAIPGVGANTFGLWSRHCSRTLPAFFMDGAPEGIHKASNRLIPFAELQ